MRFSTTAVHPTAIVAAGARLGKGCQVGPYCVIADGATLGDRNILHNAVTIGANVHIGDDNVFFPHSVIGMPPQLGEHEPFGALAIGSRNVFREGFTTQGSRTLAGRTTIGNDNRFLTNSHIGHDGMVGDGSC